MQTKPTLDKKARRIPRRLQSRHAAQCAATFAMAVAVLSSGILTAHAQSLHGKADLFLTRRTAAVGWTSVIAKCPRSLTPTQERQLRLVGADVYRHLGVIHAVALRIPTRNLNQLAALPFVQHLSADMPVRKCDEFSMESSGAGSAFAQYGLTGSAIRVAVVDSGIHDGADFAGPVVQTGKKSSASSRLVAQINFVADSSGQIAPASADDTCGHGTHVAGILGGNGTNSNAAANAYRTFYGIARQADLINVRVLDAKGQSDVSTVIAGIQWVIQNQAAYKIRVMNLSLGHAVGESYTTDPLCQAVEQAWQAGITVVCAAGNEGRVQNVADPSQDNEGYGTAYGSIQSPGNDPYVITVGAMKPTDLVFNSNGTWTHTRSNDHIATYSSRGPSRLDLVMKPDLVAPGNKIISVTASGSTLDTMAGNTNNITKSQYLNANRGQGKKISGDYFRLSGTSMAAPVVAGAAALLLQQDPTLTPDTIKARLMIAADKWGDAQGNADPCTYGAGYLNIPAALQCTASPNQAALSPSMSVDGGGNVYINMDRALWGKDSAYGLRAVWGVSGVNDLRGVWGTRAIWGRSDNLLDASRALWGKSVWGDRAIWGRSAAAADLSTNAINGE